ncbi:MAG: hypothetical protein ACPKQO_10130 [Nitrososphaeraceae archaeon]
MSLNNNTAVSDFLTGDIVSKYMKKSNYECWNGNTEGPKYSETFLPNTVVNIDTSTPCTWIRC